MTITINQTYFYYWIIAIVFETIYVYVSFKIEWKKVKKKEEQYSTVIAIIKAYKEQATYKLLWKKIFNPITYVAVYILFCITSPIFFPFSLFKLIRKMFGYKTKLEKQSEIENQKAEEARKRHEEWMKTEGDMMPDQQPIKHE